MALPDLTATLVAKTDGFESSLSRAAKASEDAARQVQAVTDKMGSGFAALKGLAQGALAAITVNAFVGLIKGAIDAADHINDLSQRTGVAVETLAGLDLSAKQSGVGLDQVASGIGKLNLQLAAAEAGNKRAGEAFKVLGISLKDTNGNALTADSALKQIADRFASAEDGPQKAALAVRLFGKAGEALIPLLNGGGDAIQKNIDLTQKYGGVSSDVAAKADKFNDTLAEINLLSGAFGRTLAAELLPPLQNLADEFLDVKEKGDGFQSVAHEIVEGLKAIAVGALDAGEVVYDLGVRLGQLGQLAAAKLNGTLIKDAGGILDEGDRKVAAMEARLTRLKAAIERPAAGPESLADRPIDFGKGDNFFNSPGKLGDLTGSGGRKGAVDDPTKKQLDQDLKALDLYIAQQKQLLSESESFLSTFYQRGEVSLGDYYTRRQTIRDTDLANTRAAYAEEISDLQKYIASISNADPKAESKRVDATTKLIDVNAKLAKAEHDAAIDAAKDLLARQNAAEAYRDTLDSLAGQVASIGGNSVAGAASGFDSQNRNKTRALQSTMSSSTSSDDERSQAQAGLDNLAQLRQEAILQAALTDQDKKRTTVLLELQNVTDRVNNAVSSGRRTELEGLVDLSTANRSRASELQGVIAAEEALAAVSKDPAALAHVDALRVQLEKLADQTDLVGDKFRAIGESATENFIDKLASGTGTIKDAFKALVSDINKELLKVGEKEISQQLFKKDGGIGGFISNLFGKGGDDSTGATAAKALTGTVGDTAKTAANDAALAGLATTVTGADAAFASLTLTTPLLDTSFATLAASASLAAAALDASAAKGAGDALAASGLLKSANGNVFNAGALVPFAMGGVLGGPTIFPMVNGKTGIGGEAGPEALVPLKRRPDGRLGIASGGQPTMNSYTTINVAAPQNRDLSTARQHGEAIRRALG